MKIKRVKLEHKMRGGNLEKVERQESKKGKEKRKEVKKKT